MLVRWAFCLGVIVCCWGGQFVRLGYNCSFMVFSARKHALRGACVALVQGLPVGQVAVASSTIGTIPLVRAPCGCVSSFGLMEGVNMTPSVSHAMRAGKAPPCCAVGFYSLCGMGFGGCGLEHIFEWSPVWCC